MIFDTHCHYNLDPLFSDWKDHWSRAKHAGVSKTNIIGTEVENSLTALAQAAQDPNLYASIALHPYVLSELALEKNAAEITRYCDESLALFEVKALEMPKKILAIGETGLDYYRLPKDQELARKIIAFQKLSLMEHCKLADKLGIPLILHVRDTDEPEEFVKNNAYWDTISVLEKHFSFRKPCILHCVSGPKKYVHALLEKGAFVGVAGNCSYPSAHSLRDLVTSIPTDRILLETDAPYLAPQQFRGKTCLPEMIVHTADFLTNFCETSREQLFENSLACFSLGTKHV